MYKNCKVNNVPAYAKNYKYLVLRPANGELNYYGAFHTRELAEAMARHTNGIVVKTNLSGRKTA